jgi:TonB family protein
VYLSFDVIDRLERETVENFRSLTSRGSEMGGILLGAVAPGTPACISVEDYEIIECDYSRGPLYRLSDADLGRFERVIEERSNAGKMQVVGFFRSHTRKGLALDAEDLQFLAARFRNPHSMALLVRPFATKASVGGIFLREETGFNTEASALEFPFRSAQLTPSKRGPEIASPTPAPTRAQVVPIATWREPSAPPTAPAIPVPSPEPVTQTQAGAPAAEPNSATPATVATASTDASLVAAEAAKTSATTSASLLAQAVAAPATATDSDISKPKSALDEGLAGAEAKPVSKVPMLTGLVAAALLGFVLLFIYPGFSRHWQRASGSASQDSSPLTLRVEHTGTDLLLTWNREAAAIRSASRATLSISDGDRHENYGMDLAQLRTGSIVYSPLGGDVSFQMEVTGPNGSRTATETLRLLRTRPSPMPAEGQPAKAEKTGNVTSSSSNPQSATPADTSPDSAAADAPAAEESKPSGAPLKPFDASSLAQRLRPAQPADLAEVPSPAAGGSLTPKVNAEGSLPFSVTVPPAPAVPSVAAPASPPTASSQIQPAQLISRKEPEYPVTARQMGAKGVVELVATIGTDGRVTAVKVVKGHPLLVKAAQDAVMQWRYRPTLLNGVPIQNETRITLNFIPGQ